MSEKDLPQQGLDDDDRGEDEASQDSTDTPGGVTVDEPTQPALNPEKEKM
jgi:hypothetical protein